jgi:hypothetical protein
MINPEPHIEPVAMTKTQLAALYKVCPRTLAKWMKPFKNEIGVTAETYIYTPAQVKTIFEKIGEP